MLRTPRPRISITSNITIRSPFIYYVFITIFFFFDDDLSFENDLYIIKYVIIVIMIINKIILRRSVGNNNNQLYFVNDLTVIISTFVLRNCYYSLMKPIQSFVPHYSTTIYDSFISSPRYCLPDPNPSPNPSQAACHEKRRRLPGFLSRTQNFPNPATPNDEALLEAQRGLWLDLILE